MVKKVRFFKTQRQAEAFVKRRKIKLKGFKATVQGNAVVFIPKRSKI